MPLDQVSEGVPQVIGRHALPFPNVAVRNMNSRLLDYGQLAAEFGEIGFVFIDGDHSYEGVKADTELALQYLVARPEGGMVVWHDVSETHPEWVGVLKYLEELAAKFTAWQIVRIEGTWLAYLVVK
jgi:hypothetical protein